jgi:hypothetical protein
MFSITSYKLYSLIYILLANLSNHLLQISENKQTIKEPFSTLNTNGRTDIRTLIIIYEWFAILWLCLYNGEHLLFSETLPQKTPVSVIIAKILPWIPVHTYMFRILLLHKRFDLLLVLGRVVMSQALLLYCWMRVGRWDAHRNKASTLSSHCKRKANPGQALRFPGGWGSHIPGPSAHKGVKGVSPTHRPPLPPGNILVKLFY